MRGQFLNYVTIFGFQNLLIHNEPLISLFDVTKLSNILVEMAHTSATA
jgi:hypothetical protein